MVFRSWDFIRSVMRKSWTSKAGVTESNLYLVPPREGAKAHDWMWAIGPGSQMRPHGLDWAGGLDDSLRPIQPKARFCKYVLLLSPTYSFMHHPRPLSQLQSQVGAWGPPKPSVTTTCPFI